MELQTIYNELHNLKKHFPKTACSQPHTVRFEFDTTLADLVKEAKGE